MQTSAWFRLIVNEKKIDEAAGSLWAMNIVIVLLAMAVAVALAYLASQALVRPILLLTESARRVSQGDLTHRTEIESEDEIGCLAEAFNTMAANLERTMKSLAAAQAKLKSVVETVGSRSRTVIERVDEQRSIIDDDVPLDRSAQQRRPQDHRQRRSALRVVRGDVVVDAGDGGVDGGSQPPHRHALQLRRRDRLGDRTRWSPRSTRSIRTSTT